MFEKYVLSEREMAKAESTMTDRQMELSRQRVESSDQIEEKGVSGHLSVLRPEGSSEANYRAGKPIETIEGEINGFRFP